MYISAFLFLLYAIHANESKSHKQNLKFLLYFFLPSGETCCFQTEILHRNENLKVKFLKLPSITDLSQMKSVIHEKNEQSCVSLESSPGIFQCNLNSICDPVQSDIKILMSKYPNSAIKTPSIHFNSVFYGSNNFDIFPVDFDNFLQTYNLIEHNLNNNSFSFLYIKQNKLNSHDNLPHNAKIICSLTSNQMFIQQELKTNSLKVKTQLEYFFNFYEAKPRFKRNDFFSEFLSETFFSDTDDLKNVHVVFNEYLKSHNRQILIEKSIFSNLEVNEHLIVKEIHVLEVSISFTKFKLLNFEHLTIVHNKNMLFISSLKTIFNELDFLQNVVNNILVKSPTEKTCVRNLGCFYNAQLLFNKNQISVELHIVVPHPKVNILNTCEVFNTSHTFAAHNTLNHQANCSELRPIEKEEFFVKEVLLIIKDSTFSYSCATQQILYINNEPFQCTKFPNNFLDNIYSFQLLKNSTNFIRRELHPRYFLFDHNETFQDKIFANHLELLEDPNSPNLTLFDHFLPPIVIKPSIFGWGLVTIIALLAILAVLVLLYFFNSTFANMLGIIQCCKNSHPPNPVIVQMRQQPHHESDESHDWQNLQAYAQN